MSTAAFYPNRSAQLRQAIRLEIVTIIWMIIEAIGSVVAAILAHSLLLLAFGIDSLIELISAGVLFRRLRKEMRDQLDQHQAEVLEQRASRIAGWLLCLLAIYIILQAAYSLWRKTAAETSFLGMAIAIVAGIGMPLLARAKLRAANQTASGALRADAMETITCGYLSWLLLVGLMANALLHLWWLDSIASLLIVPLLAREAKEAFSGKCCYG